MKSYSVKTGAYVTRIRVHLSDKDFADRWTAVFTGKQWTAQHGLKPMLGMSDNPTDPQGVSMFSEGMEGSHLGKRIAWADIPMNIRAHILYRINPDN